MTPNIKKIPFLLAVTIMTGLLALSPLLAAAAIIDRVVAEVNGEVITLSELEAEMAAIGEDFLRQVALDEREKARDEARRQVLAGMIDRLLVEQRAAERGIFVDERDVEAAMEQIMADNRLSREEFERELQRAGTNLDDYRRDLRAQILQSRLLNVEVRGRIVIPEARSKRYYEENYTGEGNNAGYRILQMGFTWPDDDDQARAEARLRAIEARERVVAGSDFRELARKISDLPSASRGGELGVFQEDELSGEMQRQIMVLEPGELTPVIQLGGAYQFFKLLHGGDSARPYAEVKEEIREKLYQQALEERFDRWVGSLREDAFIRIML